MQPIILHIDMNSYFASVEQQDHPEWRGKPLGVCEHLGGIIIAASREAKLWGIGTGTPVWEAKKLYPKIILVKTKPDRYRYFTARFLKVFGDYTDHIDKYSIDEAFLDVTKACNIRLTIKDLGLQSAILNLKSQISNLVLVNPFEEAVRVAQEIKLRMRTEVGEWLTCSIGIASNKLVAKIGSDLKKPDGLVVVTDKDSPCAAQGESLLQYTKDQLYDRLELTDIPGIGKRQERNLNELDIHTLRDLRDYPESKLIARFGVQGHHLHNMGQLEGSWKENFEEENIKSIGHMYTLPEQYRKAEYVLPVLYKLSEMVAKRLRDQELMGNTISFFLHGSRHEGVGKSHHLKFSMYDGRDIFLQAVELHKALPVLPVVKLIGITVSGLSPLVVQQSLFKDEEKQMRIMKALDAVNEKYEDFTLSRCLAFSARHAIRDSVGFGRMKEFGKWYGAGGG
jgi:DNA polymerase-4